MLGYLQYLFAALIVASARAPGVDVPARPDGWGIALAIVAFALGARLTGVLMARRPDDERRDALPGLLLAMNAGRVAALGLYYVILMKLGGVHLPDALGIGTWVLVPWLVQLAPFALLTAAAVWGLQPAADRILAGWDRASTPILAEFRQALLPLVPVLVFFTIDDLTQETGQTTAIGRALGILQRLPSIRAFSLLAVVLLLLCLVPFVLRIVWRAKPMPPSPLRERLEAYSKRIGFRYREILVWPAGGDVINAAVIGAFPMFRYVLITDGLLHTLSPDEVEAVYAHEAGHARRGHILLFFGFTGVLSLVGFVPGVAQFLDSVLPANTLLRGLIALLVWLGVVMGWISRRFEQEADVFGLDTIPLPPGADPAEHPFGRALDRIGHEVGGIREITGWRHFSIADRVAFVRSYLTDEAVRRSYRRSILLLRGSLLLVIGAFTVAAALPIPSEIRAASTLWKSESEPDNSMLLAFSRAVNAPDRANRMGFLAEAARFATESGRDEAALRWLRESYAMGNRTPGHVVLYAETLERTGRPLGAKRLWNELAERADLSSAERDFARRRAAADQPR